MAARAHPIPMLDDASKRLVFLDALRGIAVLAVVVQHLGSASSARFEAFSQHHFGLGAFGVTIFFLCSGYIIPTSLERHGSLRRFWSGRFWRLYPLYWCSLTATLFLMSVGALPSPVAVVPPPLATVAANAAMIQLFVGQPNLLHVYWTLGYELLFYALVSLLYLARIHRWTAPITLTILLLPLVLGGPGSGALMGIVYTLGTMFMGTVVYRLHSGQLRRGGAVALVLLAPLILAAILIPWGAQSMSDMASNISWLNGQALGWLAGYGMAMVVFAGRRYRFPRPLIYIGTISYSLYLFHALVVAALPIGGRVPLRLLVWLIVIVALAATTYRWIERPAMWLGRHRVRLTFPVPCSSPR